MKITLPSWVISGCYKSLLHKASVLDTLHCEPQGPALWRTLASRPRLHRPRHRGLLRMSSASNNEICVETCWCHSSIIETTKQLLCHFSTAGGFRLARAQIWPYQTQDHKHIRCLSVTLGADGGGAEQSKQYFLQMLGIHQAWWNSNAVAKVPESLLNVPVQQSTRHKKRLIRKA